MVGVWGVEEACGRCGTRDIGVELVGWPKSLMAAVGSPQKRTMLGCMTDRFWRGNAGLGTDALAGSLPGPAGRSMLEAALGFQIVEGTEPPQRRL